MGKEEKRSDEFLVQFRKQMSEVNELSNIILNGHLEVEKHLDDAVDLIFFRPEQLHSLRLSFYEKVQIAKAYCPDPDAKDWEVIKCFGELRNSIAHMKVNEKKDARLKKLRQTMRGWGAASFREIIKDADDKELIIQASALCSAFLLFLEDSTWKVREVIAKTLDVPPPPEND